MNPSRRQVLQLLAAAPVLPLSGATGAPSPWQAALDLPRSECFGVTEEGKARDGASLYRLETGGGTPLSFDISNSQILCSMDQYGTLDRVCINNGVLPLAGAAISGGVYTMKALVRGGPWRFTVQTGSSTARGDVAVSLIANVIPEFAWHEGPVRVRQIAFAPVDRQDPARSPRAIVLIFLFENLGAEKVTASVVAPENPPSWLSFGALEHDLAPGVTGVVEIAVLLDESAERLKARAPIDWFRDTLEIQTARYGSLRIPDAPYFAEGSVRFAENCRQSMLRLPDGRFGGGFMGSDIDARDWNWNKDTYYCVLGSSLFEPSLCAAAIPFYFQWGLPAKPNARGLVRYPDGARVTQSLSIALAPLSLAATYYRLTGDGEYFKRYPNFLAQANALCEEVVATRRGDPFLFPSMFISNGDARGHYHTGSNVVAWYAFRGLSRIAGEVFGDQALRAQWGEVASRVRKSLLEYCTGIGNNGEQFFEGVHEDRMYVPGHDGEETDTTLMPFYGFCRADDPRLIRHAKAGLSPANPYYAKDLDGIWWYDGGGFRPATAPAWATGLASAATESELGARLNRFRELTDLDGSLWWWPYRHGETDRKQVLRGNGTTKCGWASAAYLLRFVHDVLGIDLDVPSQRITFRPFVPWSEFEWKEARFGAARFDLHYRREPGVIRLEITNKNAVPYNTGVQLAFPANAKVQQFLVNGETINDWKTEPLYDQQSVGTTRTLEPGKTLRATIRTN